MPVSLRRTHAPSLRAVATDHALLPSLLLPLSHALRLHRPAIGQSRISANGVSLSVRHRQSRTRTDARTLPSFLPSSPSLFPVLLLPKLLFSFSNSKVLTTLALVNVHHSFSRSTGPKVPFRGRYLRKPPGPCRQILGCPDSAVCSSSPLISPLDQSIHSMWTF